MKVLRAVNDWIGGVVDEEEELGYGFLFFGVVAVVLGHFTIGIVTTIGALMIALPFALLAVGAITGIIVWLHDRLSRQN